MIRNFVQKPMKSKQINQSEELIKNSFLELLEKISEHVRLLAMYDEPIERLIDVKRALYQLKGQFYMNQAEANNSQKQCPDIEMSGADLRVMWLVEELQNKLGVDVLDSVKIGMVGEDDLKRVLIKHEYMEMARQGYKYKDVKQLLSWQYGWSVSRIEKLVYRG